MSFNQYAGVEPIVLDGYRTVLVQEVPTWKDVFNCSHHWHGSMFEGAKVAKASSYPFFTWSGRVFHTLTGFYTGIYVEALK